MMLWRLIRTVLFRFDAERVHHASIVLIRTLGRFPIQWLSGAPSPYRKARPSKRVVVASLEFEHPVGLAAGFDKNAEILPALPRLGFAFAEIGTVTPRAQPGNDRPRLFRVASEKKIFNRMGFNNLGAELVARNVARAKPSLPGSFRIGINIGKNKNTPNSDAHRDYADAIRPFEGLADYVVVNVSSPNTSGLRELQETEAIARILGAVSEACHGWKRTPPLFVKLAPELDVSDLRNCATTCLKEGVSGFVLTNTLKGTFVPPHGKTLEGGWSGSVLSRISFDRLRELRQITDAPIISVGGIMTPQDARTRLEAGASLVQIYSGWIFEGPRFPTQIVRALDSDMG